MIFRRLTLLCLCLVSVIVRDCQPMQVDLNAKLQNNEARKDLEQTLENAGLEVVDTQRLPVIRRTSYNTSAAAAEVKQTEGDQQITEKTRADWLQEEEEDEEEEEEEEEWLPVYIGGRQKINGEHREGKRVKREGEGKSPKLQQKATDGQLQYTTLDTRNLVDEASDDLADAGNGEVDTSGEDKEGKNDRPTETPKDSETLEERSEDGTAKEDETVKQHDGEVNVKAEAPDDDAEEEETPREDDTPNKEKIAEADDKQNEKETSKEDTSEKDDVPTNDQKSKEESKETRDSDELVQNEGNGNDADGHLTNSDLSKGKSKEPVGDDDDDDDGSGSEEDEKTGFLSEAPDSKDDTSDESRTKDEESEGKVPFLNDDNDDDNNDDDDDDEAKEQLTATPNEKDADEDKQSQTEEDKDKQSPTDEDKNDSKGSNEDSNEGSGEAEEQNIEPRTGSEKEPGNPEKERQNGEDDGTTKKESKSSKWQYHGVYGPGNWSKEFSGCCSGHHFQSPINIVPEQAQFDDTREKITFTMTHSEEKSYSVLFNDAKTAKVIFENMDIRVNGLDKIYQVAWVQFHWGTANNAGSEHVIAGNRYPLEMQALCYDKENFPDLMEAEWVAGNTSSTIVMLATLFEISNQDNPLLKSVVENLKSIQSPGQNISIESLDLNGLLPKKSEYFYRYSGSLTSPPCQGGAEWIVFHDHQTISPSQVAKFRQLHEEDFEDGTYSTVDYNWRPVQPLNGRVVTRSFPIPKKGNPSTLKSSPIRSSNSSSHCSPAIDISVCTLLFMWKLFLG